MPQSDSIFADRQISSGAKLANFAFLVKIYTNRKKMFDKNNVRMVYSM